MARAGAVNTIGAIKTRWRPPLVAARAAASPGERAEGAISLDQGRDLRADRGGWLWHCHRQRSVARGAPGAGADSQGGRRSGRQAQLARLQAIRMMLWNQASADPIKAAEALIKLEAREARLLGLDMPQRLAITDPDGGIPLESVRRILERLDAETVDVTPEPAPLPLAIRERMIGAIGSYRLDSAKPPGRTTAGRCEEQIALGMG